MVGAPLKGWVTIPGKVGNHILNGGLSHMAIITWSSFCELSLGAKYQFCSIFPLGRFWWGLLFVICFDRGKTKSNPSPTDWSILSKWTQAAAKLRNFPYHISLAMSFECYYKHSNLLVPLHSDSKTEIKFHKAKLTFPVLIRIIQVTLASEFANTNSDQQNWFA